MKTIKKVEITPVFVDVIPDELEQNKFYIAEQYNVASHLCLCGCGKETITPLGGGRNWDLIKENNNTITLLGSVGNYSYECKSHYVINKNIASFLE